MKMPKRLQSWINQHCSTCSERKVIHVSFDGPNSVRTTNAAQSWQHVTWTHHSS